MSSEKGNFGNVGFSTAGWDDCGVLGESTDIFWNEGYEQFPYLGRPSFTRCKGAETKAERGYILQDPKLHDCQSKKFSPNLSRSTVPHGSEELNLNLRKVGVSR